MAVTFLDLNQSTPTDTPMLVGIDAVFQSVFNIMSVVPGERLWLPDFGMNLARIQFLPIDDLTSAQIERMIYYSFSQWDPRIRVVDNQSSVTPDPDNSKYDIKVALLVSGLPTVYTYTGQLQVNQ